MGPGASYSGVPIGYSRRSPTPVSSVTAIVSPGPQSANSTLFITSRGAAPPSSGARASVPAQGGSGPPVRSESASSFDGETA